MMPCGEVYAGALGAEDVTEPIADHPSQPCYQWSNGRIYGITIYQLRPFNILVCYIFTTVLNWIYLPVQYEVGI